MTRFGFEVSARQIHGSFLQVWFIWQYQATELRKHCETQLSFFAAWGRKEKYLSFPVPVPRKLQSQQPVIKRERERSDFDAFPPSFSLDIRKRIWRKPVYETQGRRYGHVIKEYEKFAPKLTTGLQPSALFRSCSLLHLTVRKVWRLSPEI